MHIFSILRSVTVVGTGSQLNLAGRQKIQQLSFELIETGEDGAVKRGFSNQFCCLEDFLQSIIASILQYKGITELSSNSAFDICDT